MAAGDDLLRMSNYAGIMQVVADYDVSQKNNTITPHIYPLEGLSDKNQPRPPSPGNTTYFAPRAGASAQSTADTQLYVKYLQRILYMLETSAVSDSTRCPADFTG